MTGVKKVERRRGREEREERGKGRERGREGVGRMNMNFQKQIKPKTLVKK